jgi:hypothetical protein
VWILTTVRYLCEYPLKGKERNKGRKKGRIVQQKVVPVKGRFPTIDTNDFGLVTINIAFSVI